MRLSTDGCTEAVYCLNVFSDDSLSGFAHDQIPAMNTVRDSLCPNEAMGLGLRFSAETLAGLKDPLPRRNFLELLQENDLYGVTLNAFPYGNFHTGKVKEQVYAPDWRTEDRLNYTLDAASLLSETLGDACSGSVSSVPGAYAAWICSDEDRIQMRRNLMRAVKALREMEEESGRYIHLGLEPEPDCFLETTSQCVSYWNEDLLRLGLSELRSLTGARTSTCEEWLRRYLGVCFDACHLAIQYENLADSVTTLTSEGILISKAHISAALDVLPTDVALNRLNDFVEPVYLHQVRAKARGGGMCRWPDLDLALKDLHAKELESLRVHFHVPLFWEGHSAFKSTAKEMTPEFFQALTCSGCDHLEVETYTFDVLPDEFGAMSLSDMILQEMAWLKSNWEKPLAQ